MSQIPRSPAVCENEHSREVPSSAGNSDSQDKDNKVNKGMDELSLRSA